MLPNLAKIQSFQRDILSYYATHGRHDLPWRGHTDPWLLLLAEITLRKTPAKQALEVFGQLSRLSPKQLSEASNESIELMLRPLGLQSVRANNLKVIASRVHAEGVDRLRDEIFLRSLPGVGPSIANAVLCNAYGIAKATVDTNVIRITERVFSYKSTHKRARNDDAFWNFANHLLPEKYPRQFNWGLQDLGTQICTAKKPRCSACPVSKLCDFHNHTVQANGNAAQPSLTTVEAQSKPQISPTVVSLFSGAGGFDWGFHRDGFQTLLACELLPDAARTLAHNLGLNTIAPDDLVADTSGVVVQGDVEKVDFSHLHLSPDVLIGGPPCQDFSVAQSTDRQGLNGGRGHLYREFVRAVMYFQPKIFVFENVPGLQSANKGKAYKTILGDLMNLETRRKESVGQNKTYSVPDYEVENYVPLFDGIVDAVNLGVPQTRRRLIIIGMRKDQFESLSPRDKGTVPTWLTQQLGGYWRHFARYPMTSMEVFEGKPLTDLGSRYREIMEEYRNLACTPNHPRARDWYSQVFSKLKLDVVEDYLSLNEISRDFAFSHAELDDAMSEHEALLKKMNWLGKPVSDLQLADDTQIPVQPSNNVIARMHHIPPDENAKFVDGTEWRVESKDISFIYRRTSPIKPAYTVMAYGGGGTHGYHYERSRTVLSLRERARIQTFSDDFLFQGVHKRAQIGEAVPPLLGQEIAEALRNILQLVG